MALHYFEWEQSPSKHCSTKPQLSSGQSREINKISIHILYTATLDFKSGLRKEMASFPKHTEPYWQ